MNFIAVAETFDAIAQTTSRLSITHLLAHLLKQATPQEAAIISYLSLGELHPSYLANQFNFAEKSMFKVIAPFFDTTSTEISNKMKKKGDLGLLMQEGSWQCSSSTPITLIALYKELEQFLEISGTGSQEQKEQKLGTILRSLDPLSSKYVVRIVLGKLRLGFSDMTLLDAFSWMATGDKSLRPKLEHAYNVIADIGMVVQTLKQDGIQAIEHVHIVPGIPIRPAGAERLSSAEAIVAKLGSCIAQPKIDGIRIQVHKFMKNKQPVIKFFSRNLNDMSEMFPEFQEHLLAIQHDNFVLEGEAVTYDPETMIYLPFQETAKRRRKYEIAEIAKELPMQLQLFDILYLDNESLFEKTHHQRREILLNLFTQKKEDRRLAVITVIDEEAIETSQALEAYFHKNVSQGFEGIVAKKAHGHYHPGKRDFNWIKLKRQETGKLDDTIDCVILGYYAGHGKRAKFGIGALLVGVFNAKRDSFETIAKIGTGLTDEEWHDVKSRCDALAINNKPINVTCAKELTPDVWVNPKIVCLIRADEISLSPLHKAGASEKKLGYALRFPRLMGFRDDKSARETTTIQEIDHLYELQFEKTHKAKKS